MNSHARFLILSAIAWGGAACTGTTGPTDDVVEQPVVCSSATPWTVGVHYNVGALVTFQGNTYQCIQAHTAQASRTQIATSRRATSTGSATKDVRAARIRPITWPISDTAVARADVPASQTSRQRHRLPRFPRSTRETFRLMRFALVNVY